MNRQRLLGVALACCCLLAVANLSASMNAAVTDDPEDVIDVDYTSLPIPADAVGDLKRAVQAGRATGSNSQDRSSSARSAERSSEASDTSNANDARSASEASSTETQRRETSGLGQTATPTDSLLQALLAFLRQLLRLALQVLLALVPLAVVAGAIYERERVLNALAALFGREHDANEANVARSVAGRQPQNRIELAWTRLVEDAGVDCGPSATPRDCVSGIVAAGYDREPVEELTNLFEDVRYGGAAVTDERTERAEECLRRATGGERGASE